MGSIGTNTNISNKSFGNIRDDVVAKLRGTDYTTDDIKTALNESIKTVSYDVSTDNYNEMFNEVLLTLENKDWKHFQRPL